jgi:Activator of Hsp90 ATPase homolog 1-like protein
MKDQDLTTTFSVDRSPEQVFAAISNVREWWGAGIEGAADKIGDEFMYRHKDLHVSTQKLAEAIPGKKLVWLVTDANLSFTKDTGEWKGTQLSFEIAPIGSRTEVRFTHVGLGPECECFEACTKGWNHYVGESLRALLTTGAGKPDPVSVHRG